MTTRPTLSSYPEDAELWKWTKDVEGFVEDLIGSNNLPSAPAEVKVVSQQNSVKVTFRAVNEVGVTEYNIYRGTEKNFAAGTSDLIATVTQAVDPAGTDIVYTDVEAVEKSYYFVSAVKGLRRPRLEGPVAGFGSATTGHAIGEDLTGGGTISGFTGIPGSILFVNEDSLIDQDNENFFYSEIFNAMVVGSAGLMWGPQASPDIVLTRDAADTLALKRGTNNQTFRIYETSSASAPAITASLLLADGDDIDRQVYGTASIAPGANRLVICMVMAADQGFNDVIHVDSVTGAGLTWVEMVDLNFDTIASQRRCLAIYRAMGPAPAGGALTITLDKVGTAARWIIVEFDNVDTSGTNGSGAIVQNATNRADAGTAITATLAAFASASNATIGCFGSGSVSTNLVEGAGFAKIGEVDLGTIKAMMTFRNDNDTTVDMTQSVDGDMAVVAFEIRSVGQNERFIELIGLGASGGAEAMAVTGAGVTDIDFVVGTRGDADLRLFRNNLEQVRISDLSTDLGLNNLAFGSAFGVEDTILTRDGAADILAMKRTNNPQDFRIYENVGAGGGTLITQTLLVAEADTGDHVTYTTASISPTPNNLILIFITGTDFGFSEPIFTNSVTGAGLTWVEVVDLQMDVIAGPRQTFSCYRALGPGATPGTLDITFDRQAALGQWIIVEFANVDTSGLNGSGAIVQFATNISDSAQTLSATLAAFADAGNATVGGFGCGAGGTPTWTPGTGFIEVAESTGSDRVSMVQFRNDNATTVDATLSTTEDIAVIALELKAASPGGNSFLDLKAFGVSGRFEVLSDGSGRDLAVGTRSGGGELFLITGGTTALTIGTDQKSVFDESVIIDGATDDVQLTVRGHSTQTSNIFLVEKDDLTNLFEVNDDGSVEFFSQTPADAMFFDPGNILGTTNPRIWMGQTATKDSTNFMIGSLGTDETRINAIRTVLITVGNAAYLRCSNVGITQVSTAHRFHIDPVEDQVQLLVDGFSTQTNDLFQLQTFDNINVFATNVAGDTTLPLAPVQTAFGGAILDYVKHLFTGTHTSLGASTFATGALFSSVITAHVADTNLSMLRAGGFGGGGLITPGTGFSGGIATLVLDEPNITDGGGGDVISSASTLLIASEPTEGVANYGIFNQATLRQAGDAEFNNDVLFTGAGDNITIGSGVVQNNARVYILGNRTSGGSSNLSGTFFSVAQHTGADGDTVGLFGMHLDNTIITQTATESIANIASLNIEEPKITDNLTGLITVASTLRIGGAPSEGVANWALNVVSGNVNLGGSLVVRSEIAQSNVTEGGTAQMVYKTAHETHTLANANTSDTTTISIPAGAKLLGASFNVNTVVVDDGGDDTWSAAFITGASESLASAAAAALNTKVNSLTANDEVTTATTEIRFTANGGNFTAGVIEIVVYYMELADLADV